MIKYINQKIALTVFLFLFFYSFSFAQIKTHPYSGTMVLSLEALASNAQTDYANSGTGFGARGLAEYFFPTTTRSIFGVRLYGSVFNITATDNKKSLKKFKTDMYSIGTGVSYAYSVEDRFFPYIYGGPSLLLFYPRDELGMTAPNAQKKLYKQNTFELDGEIGFRLNLQENINLNANVAYHLTPTDYLDDLALGNSNDGYLTASLGVSIALFGKHDSDGDGIEDSKDKCPNEPEDFDGFQDDDGCPDPDNDHDGILDVNDKCPNVPEDIDGFQDDDGCPDVDNDNDGIPDSLDKCPNAPEDFDGFQDQDGCPDVDNDRDGILDKYDKCPNEPEDFDGFQDQDGCPDYDNDNDGIPDSLDKCPNEPETINGYKDDDGCPDVAPRNRVKNNNSSTKSPKVKVPPVKTSDIKTNTSSKTNENTNSTPSLKNLPNKFLLYGVLTFEDEESQIKPSGYKELDRIVSIIKQYPKTKWRIEGYMDNQGSEYRIKTLSTNRAKAVLNYFVSKGLPFTQFEAVGMGDKNPIESNDKPYGRSKNRRVEIKRIQ